MRTLRNIVLVVTAVVVAVVVAFLFFLPPRVGGELATYLSERTGHDVEVVALRWSFVPGLRLAGQGIHVAGDRDGAGPLIDIGTFTLDASLPDLLASPRRIRSVAVTELLVHIPRRRNPTADGAVEPEPSRHEVDEAPVPSRSSTDDAVGATTPVVVGQVIAERARIEIAREPEQGPRVFDIQSLVLGSVALDRPISFEAHLTNPRPVGQVATTGELGPWHRSEARDTPISGTYEFLDADLATFRGIAGILASTGQFWGTLGQIEAAGEADIPDFSVNVGQVVPLKTAFEVGVGDRGGDIQLRSVDTRFLDSRLVATGEVVRSEERPGRTVVVDVEGRGARVEDLIRFGLESDTPPITGTIDLDTTLEIPPGDRPVIERMIIVGEFTMHEAEFTNLDVQKTLTQISQVGQGASEAESGSSVVSNLRGDFELSDAVLSFSRLTFGVPGMELRLVGRYGLRDQTIDFAGEIQLEQSVSGLVRTSPLGGRGADWLRLLDPVFESDEGGGGTVVPITISGSRTQPRFSVQVRELTPDWRRLLQRFSGER